jgi:phospholipid transport system transporter-binding protein
MIDVKQVEQTAIFSGALTRATITRAFDKQNRQLVENKRMVLDLAKISQIDTAGLAWILLLIELAASKTCHISLINIPDDLLKLAKLSAVDTLLPIENT